MRVDVTVSTQKSTALIIEVPGVGWPSNPAPGAESHLIGT